MRVAVPREIKDNENRIAITPAGVDTLVRAGHQVFVEAGAGVGSGISDDDLVKAGAKLCKDHAETFAAGDMVMKVKEPLESEYPLIRKGQIVFTYFHFAPSRPLTEAMIRTGAVCIAYETVEEGRTLPLLTPMSEVAGRMSIQQGAKYMEKPSGGRGILLGGVPGVPPAEVVILGGGVVGTNAAKMAAGMGAFVTVVDVSLDRLRYLDDVMPANVTTLYSNSYNIRGACRRADLVIGAVLIPGAKAPYLVDRALLREMKPGAVLVDVAVDQGGCAETTRPTTHSNPTFVEEGVVHYCVANMPGAVGRTSTYALTNTTLPYARILADRGWREAVRTNRGIATGANIIDGKVTCKGVAEAFGLSYHDPLAMVG
jgi:alanine dehydrogenase